MSNMFSGLKTEGLERNEDRVGGSFLHNADIYSATVKVAYAIESAKGAMGVAFVLDLGQGREHREQVYMTNRDKENFYITKDKKKAQLPGFVTINDLCRLTTDKEVSEQDMEERVLQIYNSDEKKEIPTSVQVLVDLTGKPVLVALDRIIENKNELVGNDYVATADSREFNQVNKFMLADDKRTVNELVDNIPEAVYHDAWLEKNKDKVKDKRTIKDGAGSKDGAPQASSGGERKKSSLFNK